MCLIPNGFRDRVISLYSSKTVDERYYVLLIILVVPHYPTGRSPRWLLYTLVWHLYYSETRLKRNLKGPEHFPTEARFPFSRRIL
jgi:hypothetical protein